MIKSFTVYTKKLFNKFANEVTFKKGTFVLNYIVGVILLIIAIYCFTTRKYIAGTFFALFSTFFSCNRLISMAFINRINANYLNTYDRFCFYDDYFTVSSYLPGGTLYSEIKHLYSEIEGVDNSGGFAYIYLDQSKIYILVKENFKEQGDFDWLSQNLSATINAKKLGIKYTMPKLSDYLAEKKGKNKSEILQGKSENDIMITAEESSTTKIVSKSTKETPLRSGTKSRTKTTKTNLAKPTVKRDNNPVKQATKESSAEKVKVEPKKTVNASAKKSTTKSDSAKTTKKTTKNVDSSDRKSEKVAKQSTKKQTTNN